MPISDERDGESQIWTLMDEMTQMPVDNSEKLANSKLYLRHLINPCLHLRY